MKKEITLEQVAKLKEYADVSFYDAKLALEQADGDLLEALLWLEKMGKITDAGAGAYTTRPEQGTTDQSDPVPEEKEEENDWGGRIKSFLVDNRLEAYHRESGREFQVPVGVCIVLLVIAFWMVPALLILGYCLGWRYRMAGPDLNRKEVNDAMEKINDKASDVVSDVVSGVKKNFNKDV